MMRENIIEQLRFCASRFSCEGCVGKCATSSNEPRTAFVLNNAADAIEELLAKVPKWISVYDRLPNPGQKVLTLGPRDALDCGKFIGLSGTERTNWQDWHWQRFGTRKVRFWIPVDALPEPPKEVE